MILIYFVKKCEIKQIKFKILFYFIKDQNNILKFNNKKINKIQNIIFEIINVNKR